jgi:(p)ppGpp synthase/HD superfamily hydrolase
VDGLTKISTSFRSSTEEQVENYRKLSSRATRGDHRRLADRLHNMRISPCPGRAAPDRA